MSTSSAADLLQGGDALMDARKYDHALQLASQVLASEPANPAGHALAARALMELGRYTDAVYAATEAVSLAPQWAYTHRLLSIALRKATANIKWPGDEYAIQAAREAVRLAPADAACQASLAEACAAAGNLGDADEAIRQALTLRPDSASHWSTASFVAIKARNWAAAEGAARRALAIDPDNYAATNNLGVALRHQGRWNVGTVAFLDAARIDPRSPTARDNVEAIGFQYMSAIAPLLLSPLLLIWPLFLSARLATAGWLSSKPEHLKPLARRLGIRVATSERYRRKFDKHNVRAQRLLSGLSAKEWSALHGRQRFSTGFLIAIAAALILVALFFAAAAVFSAPTTGAITGYAITAVVFMAGASLIVTVVFRRRRYFL